RQSKIDGPLVIKCHRGHGEISRRVGVCVVWRAAIVHAAPESNDDRGVWPEGSLAMIEGTQLRDDDRGVHVKIQPQAASPIPSAVHDICAIGNEVWSGLTDARKPQDQSQETDRRRQAANLYHVPPPVKGCEDCFVLSVQTPPYSAAVKSFSHV